MIASARSEDSMGRQPRSMPRRYATHGAARTALERIYSGSRTIVITKQAAESLARRVRKCERSGACAVYCW